MEGSGQARVPFRHTLRPAERPGAGVLDDPVGPGRRDRADQAHTLVLASLYRPPALLARMSSTLDVVSKGRLELGIGAGGAESDHVASGFSFPATSVRVSMLEEAIQIIKLLWGEAEASFDGRFYTLRGAVNEPKPVQTPRPPILVGGHGETHLLGAAARYADICNIGFEMSLHEHRTRLRALEKHCRKVGRDPSEIEVSHNTRVLIAKNGREFEKMASRAAARLDMSVSAYKASLAGAVAGTPEQCAEQLQSYVDSGITYFFLLFPDPISPESLELFAREVMPHFGATPAILRPPPAAEESGGAAATR